MSSNKSFYRIPKIILYGLLSVLYYLRLIKVITTISRLDASFFRIGYSSYSLDFLFKKNHISLASSVTENNIFRFRKEINKIGLPKKSTPSKLISKTSHLEVCQIFFNLSSKLGYKPFLVFGTLLGAIRENDFIKWDADLDVGLFYDEIDVNELVRIFKENGFFVEEKGHKTNICGLKLYLRPFPTIDVVFFRRKSDYFETSVIILNNYINRKRKVFDIVPYNFMNTDVFIPKNPEEFLNENYGDWQVPKSIYHFLFDSELTDFSDIRINYMAKNYLLRLLIKNYYDKFYYYLDLFRVKFPEDPFFKNI